MKEKVIHLKDIGAVRLFKSNKAKLLNITIKPFTGVQVSVPRVLSFAKAEKIVHQRTDWIKRHLPRIKKAESSFTVFDNDTRFKTRLHKLEIQPHCNEKIKVTVSQSFIKVRYPESINVKDNMVQLAIRKGIEIALRNEAKEFLPLRVNELAEKHGFQYKDVKIRNAKTRWGSCSNINTLNLSLNLMRLPSYLIDYVILHELAHTVYKNHSTQFWLLLDKVTGNAKGLNKELNNYKIQIY